MSAPNATDATVLGAAVPGFIAAHELPTVRSVRRFSVVAPDGRLVRVSVDSPAAVGRFRQLATIATVQRGVGELLAAGTTGSTGFVVQPLPGRRLVDLLALGGVDPGQLGGLLARVAGTLDALHDAGLVFGALAVSALVLDDPSGGVAGAGLDVAVLDDLLSVLPLGDRVPTNAAGRFVGGVPSAPELTDGAELTPATDVFGLAAVLATMLIGSTGWVTNPAAALRRYGSGSAAVLTALSIDPAARRVGVQELLQAVTGLTAGAPAPASVAPVSAAPASVAPVVAPASAAPSAGPSAAPSAAHRAATSPAPAPAQGSGTLPPPPPAPAPAPVGSGMLPPPPPVRSRQPLPSAALAAPTGPAIVRHTPCWQREIDDAALRMWGPVDPLADPIDRPDLRFRSAAVIEELTEEPERPLWRSPVLICSVLATIIVLVVAGILIF
ncbi:MAG: hypothetical protein JWN95_3017 [Frankiales bacterium]|nr:hypothetical protein [Frankiales bacterium]